MKATILSILLLISCSLNAQLFEEKRIFPGVKSIEGKYFNGSGGGGYWTLEELDDRGRIINKKNYKKSRLLAERALVYNEANDLIMDIGIYSVNNPARKDSIHISYQYDEKGHISYQCRKFSAKDSIVHQLEEVIGDSLYLYLETSSISLPNNAVRTSQTRHKVLLNKQGLVTKKTVIVPSQRFKLQSALEGNQVNVKWDKAGSHSTPEFETTTYFFRYYPNGKLKRRKVEHNPEPEIKGVFVGGPGSDDMGFEYKYDTEGRVIKQYSIVEGKKYKVAVYKYNLKKN